MDTLKKYLDKSHIGFVAGLVMPIAIFFLLYLIKYNMYDFEGYLHFAAQKFNTSRILKICIFFNLPLILAGNFIHILLFCRGVIFATLIYLLFMFYLLFLS